MTFEPLNTADGSADFRKTLLYAEHGFGKTTQAKHYQRHYGKGFIISGEAGLSSIRSAGIDYLAFSSFDGPCDPTRKVFSFMGLCRLILSDTFVAKGYQWLMLDSYTELSDMIWSYAVARAEREAAEAGKKVNGFDKYGYYDEKAIGAAKFIRDLPYQILITALSKEAENEDGTREHWPMVGSSKVRKQLPGIFDNVFGGIATTPKATKEVQKPETERFIVTGNYGGWKGKVRDENGVVELVERLVPKTGSVIDVIKKMEDADSKAVKAN